MERKFDKIMHYGRALNLFIVVHCLWNYPVAVYYFSLKLVFDRKSTIAKVNRGTSIQNMILESESTVKMLPSGSTKTISFTEVKHGCVRSKTGWATFQINDQKQLTPPSLGRDVKLGAPCLDAACTVGLN